MNKLSIETSTQVMLRVKIAEVTRDLTKSLGISWRAMSTGNDITGVHYGFVTGNTTSFLGKLDEVGKVQEELLKTGGGLLSADVKGGRWMMHYGGKNGLSGLIDALANESYASVLAEPTLIALSGKEATFKSGGEQGYLVTQPGGNGTATTEFKDWGTEVTFTPIVLSEDRINITVKPSVSTLSFNAGMDKPPALVTKEASTTVELGSGESLAIAGLLQRTEDNASIETPLLADIPLIGALFRQSGVSKHEKELIIIVTPYIVKPSSKSLKTPVDMVPRMYSPLESMLARKFHKTPRKSYCAGFSIK
jgi:pilus assembly protein CpaC